MGSAQEILEEISIETDVNGDVQATTIEELLINCVMVRPSLWDSRLSIKERSKNIRDQLWQDIYEEFGSNPEFSVEFLMKKWRNLRDTYVRLKGEYSPSGSACKKKKKWEFFELMTFLNDTLTYKSTVSNVTIPEVEQATIPSPMISSEANEKSEPVSSQKRSSTQKIEYAIIDALNNINTGPVTPMLPVTSSPPVNLICSRISELLSQMPQQERTVLEIKLLQLAYEAAKDYLQ